MGSIALSKTNRLFWLGRYVERTVTVVEYAQKVFDEALDGNRFDYADYCARLEIPNDYASEEEFFKRYLFDKNTPDSLLCCLSHAYDNAIVLRETISSPALSYIQLAMTAMENAANGVAPMLELQTVKDYLMAFRGSCEDYVTSENCRNIIKCGVSVERIDLYLRLDYHLKYLDKEFAKLTSRLGKTRMSRDGQRLKLLLGMAPNPNPAENRDLLLDCVENLFLSA